MIKKLLGATALTAFAGLMAMSAFAADDKPAIVFDIGGKFDKSFNESMFNGSEKFKADTGVAYGEFEIANEAQREQAIRNFADQGYSPIIAAGFAQAAAVEKVAKQNRLAIIFDKSGELVMIYTDPRHDYTDFVLEELGLGDPNDKIK